MDLTSAKANLKRNKFCRASNMNVDTKTKIRDVEQDEVYKYLGRNEVDGIKQTALKVKIRREDHWKVLLHFHLFEYGYRYNHDTNLLADYGKVCFISTYVVSPVIFPSFKENLYTTAYESVHGSGRIAPRSDY